MKAVRLLLALSVSIWMAGGCLFGCSGSAMAAATEDDVQTVVAGDNCNSARSHDCCTRPKATQTESSPKQPEGIPSFVPAPRGMMKDCPLVVNATAATSKNSGHVPEPGREPVSAVLLIENNTEHANTVSVVSFLPNRGPTHLRCCVFLI